MTRPRVIATLAGCGAIAVLLVVVSAAPALPSCTDTYNSADTGGDWSTAANWSTGVVPTSSTIACWGPAVTVVVSTGDTADSIQGGLLDINGGALDLANVSDDSTVGNVTLAASGILDGPSPLTIDGSFTWTGAGQLDATITQVDGSGTCFTINGTGQAYLTGGSVQTSCQVSIDNTGTINTGGATVTTTSTVDFGSGVVVGQGGATFTAAGVVGPGSGTYGFAGDALVLTGGSTSVAAGETLESGPLTVQSGQTVTIASTGGMEQTGGAGQIESGGVVKGAGSLDVAGGSLDVDSGGTLSSGFGVSGGTLTSDSGSTTGSSSSTVSVSSGTLQVNGAATTGNVTFTGGAIAGAAQLSVDGTFTWTGQAQLDADIVQTDGSGKCFTINGTGQAYLTGGSVQTSCQVTIDNPGTINTGNATVTTTSTLDFGSGVVVGQGGSTFTAAGVVGPGSGTYGFDGDVLVLTGGTPGTTTVVNGETLESASLIVQSGQTATIDSGGTVEQLGGGAGQIESGGVVKGAGSLDVAGGSLDVDSGGTLSSGFGVSGGTLTADSGSTTGSSSSTVSVSSGTLQVNGAATTGNVTFSGGAIAGAAQLSVDGTFTWTGQAQLDADIVQTDGSGKCFTINGTGQAYLTGGSVQTSCQVTIDNPGTINTGNATVTTTSTLDFGSGVVVGQGGSTFTAAGVVGPGSGTYGFDGDVLVLTGGTPGTTTVVNGETLESASLIVQSGQTATIDSGGTVEQLGGGAGQIESGGVVKGAGSLDVAGGTLDVDSGGTLSSGFGVSGGTLTADSGSTTGSSSSTVSVSSGTLQVNGAATTGNVTFSGGQIAGAAQLSVHGSFDWTAQAQLDADIVQTDGSGTCFTISGTGQAYLTGGSVQTSCQVTISNPGFITAGNATVTTTSTLDFADGLDMGVNGGDNATFTAAGVAANAGPTYGTGADNLVLTGGSTTVVHGNTLDSGPVTIQGGTLQDDGTVNGATTLTGGTLDGTGTLAGSSVTNTSGTVEAGDAGVGTLSVSGSYTQGSGGTLTVPISGANSGDYPVLAVSGMVTLNGTVALEPTNAYANSAQDGDVVSFMSFTSNDNSTTPAKTTVPALHDGEQFSLAPTLGDFWEAFVGSPAPPAEMSAPVVSGTAQQGDQLSTTNGTWTNVSNDGATYSYSWEDCPTATPPTGCTPISGTNSSTYTLTSTDVGQYVTVIVTAHNASESSGTATGAPVKGPVLPLPPTETNPTITGTPAVGATLTCTPGTSTGSPTFTYTWQLNGVASGAASSTYTVPGDAAGGQLTCVVKATNNGGSTTATSAPVTVPTPATPPAAPQPVGGGPTVTGTPLPGDTLTCNPGTWTGSPTFTYQWNVDSNPATGATEKTYTVTVLDEGQTITCTVAATNSTGTVNATSSVGVIVAQPGTLTCPKPSGSLTARRIGPLALGESRKAARRALKHYAVTHNGFDNFCLYGGWGIRGAYKANKFVLLLTANPYYKLASVSVGLKITSVAKRLKLGKVIPIGLNDWYVAPGAGSNYIFKVRHGIIQEIGIANKHDTATRAQQKRFLRSFKAA